MRPDFASVWRLCLIKPDWHWCRGSARCGLVAKSELLNEALYVVKRLCQMRPE